MRIIGIDPGSHVCGYGIIDASSNTLALVEYGVVEARRKHAKLPQRLEHIYERLHAVVKRTTPTSAAMEALFYARNVQSLLKLAHARGVAMLVLAQQHLAIAEYAARSIKQSITGRGNATKEQVSYMVKAMLNIRETPDFFDATDALAVAITHALQSSLHQAANHRALSWREFIEANPERLIKPS